MCLKCRYRFLNNFRTSDMKVSVEYSNCLSQPPQRVLITHGDNTLHLLDFSDKAACITTAGSHGSRAGEDPTQRHQRASVTGTTTRPREKHQDLHAHKQSVLTPANRKCQICSHKAGDKRLGSPREFFVSAAATQAGIYHPGGKR